MFTLTVAALNGNHGNYCLKLLNIVTDRNGPFTVTVVNKDFYNIVNR